MVGATNTAVGFTVIAVLDAGLSAPPALANAAGYAAAIPCGFVLNRRFVFRSQTEVRATVPRYMLVVALGFALNQAVLRGGLALLQLPALARLAPLRLEHLGAQGCGMVAYTVAVFLACRLWVFRTRDVRTG